MWVSLLLSTLVITRQETESRKEAPREALVQHAAFTAVARLPALARYALHAALSLMPTLCGAIHPLAQRCAGESDAI